MPSPSSPSEANANLPSGENYQEIKAWVEALPIIDAGKALSQAIPALNNINRAQLSEELRFRIMGLFASTLNEPVQILRKKYAAAPLPLTGKNGDRAADVMRFMKEMAAGYKIIINGLAKTKASSLNEDEKIQTIYYAVAYIGQLLLENYACYESLRPKTWSELNALFKFSLAKKIHTAPVEIAGNVQGTVEQAYMQLLLLSAINPYRLMRGEAEKVYKLMGEWSSLCRLQPPPQGWCADKELIIQLGKDEPPRHTAPKETIDDIPALRIVDVSTLKTVIQKRLDENKGGASQGRLSVLADRLQRNMLLRLVDGWKSKNDRESPRIDCTENLQLVVGLKSSHFVLGENQQSAHPGQSKASSSEMDLIPKQEEMDEYQAAMWDEDKEAGAVSQFEVDDPHSHVWTMQTLTSDNTKKEVASSINTYPLVQTNQSKGGVSAHFEFVTGLQPRVGELVCFRSESKKDSKWKLGAARWLIFSFGEGDLGIQTLAENAQPIAVKALDGVGKGGDRLQAMLIGADTFEHPDARLIVPASLYDCGTVLYVESATDALRVQLTTMQDTTESFSCFAFTL